jgi:hypothetical protein
MSEGKSAGFFPPLFRGLYAAPLGHGIGLGPGTGSPPSATNTPVDLSSLAAALRLALLDDRACTTVGKTATAANKTKVTRLPRTLSFDIFISFKELAMDGCCRHEHLFRPRAKPRRFLKHFGLCPLSGWYPDQKTRPSYVSECVIAPRGKGSVAGALRPVRPTTPAYNAPNAVRLFRIPGVGGKGSGNLCLQPFAA